jgi:hypothetical protein
VSNTAIWVLGGVAVTVIVAWLVGTMVREQRRQRVRRARLERARQIRRERQGRCDCEPRPQTHRVVVESKRGTPVALGPMDPDVAHLTLRDLAEAKVRFLSRYVDGAEPMHCVEVPGHAPVTLDLETLHEARLDPPPTLLRSVSREQTQAERDADLEIDPDLYI